MQGDIVETGSYRGFSWSISQEDDGLFYGIAYVLPAGGTVMHGFADRTNCHIQIRSLLDYVAIRGVPAGLGHALD